jgi:hypothetical protein
MALLSWHFECLARASLFSAKVGFSGFSLGNNQKIAFVANANLSPFSAKMAGA